MLCSPRGPGQVDPDQRAVDEVRELSRADFAECGVVIDAHGDLSVPTC
jgi:hypothetical protein